MVIACACVMALSVVTGVRDVDVRCLSPQSNINKSSKYVKLFSKVRLVRESVPANRQAAVGKKIQAFRWFSKRRKVFVRTWRNLLNPKGFWRCAAACVLRVVWPEHTIVAFKWIFICTRGLVHIQCTVKSGRRVLVTYTSNIPLGGLALNCPMFQGCGIVRSFCHRNL